VLNIYPVYSQENNIDTASSVLPNRMFPTAATLAGKVTSCEHVDTIEAAAAAAQPGISLTPRRCLGEGGDTV